MKQNQLVLSLMLAYSSLQAAQIVEPASNERIIVNPGETAVVSPYYRVTVPQDSTESGLGIRVHYNSQALGLYPIVNNAISNTIRLPDGSTMTDLQPIGISEADVQNYDGDSSTDRYFIVAWVDPSMNWPQRVLPTKLFDVYFTVSNSYSGNTVVRFTATATSAAAGSLASFQSSPITVCIDNNGACFSVPGDIDGDGQVTVLDAYGIYAIAIGSQPPNQNADCNQDGRVTVVDAYCAYAIATGIN